MPRPSSRFFTFSHLRKQYKVHYLDWGDSELPLLICAHGLTRNARDFDFLADYICDQYRVIAVDFPGRGLSDWLDTKHSYSIPTYIQVIEALLMKLDANIFNWLGTSMGGLIGIIMAAQHPNKMNRLIINDVGPELSPDAIARIGKYISTIEKFDNKKDFENHIRQVYSPFGQLTDHQWHHLVQYGFRLDAENKLRCNYDPGIAIPFIENANSNANLWDFWQNICIPVYLLHGENSDILSVSIIEKMIHFQPDLSHKSIKNVGHAPALMDQEQIQLILHWLSDMG